MKVTVMVGVVLTLAALVVAALLTQPAEPDPGPGPGPGPLSASELARALDVRWWTITVPPEADGGSMGVVIRTFGDAEPVPRGVTGVRAGETYRVILQEREGRVLEWCFMSKFMTHRNSIDAPDGTPTIWEGIGTEVQPGQWIMKVGPPGEGGVSVGPDLREGESALVVAFSAD